MNLTSEPSVGPLSSPTVLTDLWMGLRYKEVWLSAILNLTSEPSVGPLASPPMLAGLQVCPRQVGGLQQPFLAEMVCVAGCNSTGKVDQGGRTQLQICNQEKKIILVHKFTTYFLTKMPG